MTLPSERTIAVIKAREFLFRVASPYCGGLKGIKSEVRVLRHFPHWFDLGGSDTFDVATATASEHAGSAARDR